MTDVIDAGINFTHPDLLEKKQAEQIATGAVAPAQEPAPSDKPAPTAASPEPKRKFAQKYDSVEELEKGYWNSAQEAQRIATENKMLKELVTSQQRVNPAERVQSRRAFEDELREAAIPVEPLDGYINERAQRVVRDVLEPIARGAQARSEMAKQFPDFVSSEPNFEQFLSANPAINDEYNRMMATPGLESAAMKYAFLNYRLANPQTQPITDASGQEQAVARATAALSGTQAGTREVADAQARRFADAAAEFEQTGDERKYAAVLFDVFKPIMPPQ